MSRFREIESKWKESGLSDMLLAKFKTLLTDESEEGVKSCVELLRSFGDEGLCMVLQQEATGQILLRDDLGIIHRLLWMAEVIAVITEEGSIWKSLYDSGAFEEMEIQILGDVKWSSLSALQQKKVVSFSMSFVEVPAGTFMMGALPNDKDAYHNEKPRHEVTLTKGMLVCKYACTQGLYEKVTGVNPSDFNGSARPVECVSWCDAVLFCNKLSEVEGLEPVYGLPDGLEEACRNQSHRRDDTVEQLSMQVTWNHNTNGYRLPTEAEWEYCARGGESHVYAGSNYLDEVAWHEDNSGNETHPVGQKKANGYGLYDMSGNVWEWVWDSALLDDDYDFSGVSLYTSTARIDPIVDASISFRIRRGGDWLRSSWYARVSRRYGDEASLRFNYRGFRFLRTLGG